MRRGIVAMHRCTDLLGNAINIRRPRPLICNPGVVTRIAIRDFYTGPAFALAKSVVEFDQTRAGLK